MERRLSTAQLLERTVTHALCPTGEPISKHLRDTFRVKNGEIAQIRSALTLSCRVLPPLRSTLEHLFLKDSLPFPTPPEVISHGFNKTVWKVTPGNAAPIACRVHFYTIGQSPDELIQSAQEKRSTYQKVMSAFSGYEDLIIPTHFMIANAPTLGKAALVELSPFVEGSDIFTLANPGALTETQKSHAGIIAEVASHKIDNQYLDLLGKRNILVSESGSTHVIDWETAPLPDSSHHFEHNKRINHLRTIAA